MFANLITSEYLKKKNIIDDNVDVRLLTTFITTAQDKYIQNRLGENLYNKIMTDVANETISGNYEILLYNFIMPCLMWYSIYEALPFINFKLTNKSVVQKTGTNLDVAETNEIDILRQQARNNGEFYGQRIKVELCNDNGKYPELDQATQINGIKPDQDTEYFGGIYIP